MSNSFVIFELWLKSMEDKFLRITRSIICIYYFWSKQRLYGTGLVPSIQPTWRSTQCVFILQPLTMGVAGVTATHIEQYNYWFCVYYSYFTPTPAIRTKIMQVWGRFHRYQNHHDWFCKVNVKNYPITITYLNENTILNPLLCCNTNLLIKLQNEG